MSVFFLFVASCKKPAPEHTHSFSETVQTEKYLKANATCEQLAEYYYSCACGEKGDKTFTVGEIAEHDYSAEVESPKYLKKEATCQKGAEYYKSCSVCGKKGVKSFISKTCGDHVFDKETVDLKYLDKEPTLESPATYFKSCVCGQKGQETFTFGDKLREYTAEEKVYYQPTSLTVTLYDSENLVYGFTYNTQKEPLRPVIQIAKGNELTDYEEYSLSVAKASTFTQRDEAIEYYIVKGEIALESSTTYTYRAYDKYVDVGAQLATIKTKDVKSTAFTFAHLSDSQMSESSGDIFGNVLSNLMETTDFIVHTGDIVETSKHEHEWTDMLNGNYRYLSQIPVMAISGNHETTYKNGSNETFKHFNNNIPNQDTALGYYYSFTYGNAKFIMLNTNKLAGNKLMADQYDWLVTELTNNTATWTVVALHNPIYSAGTYGANPDRNGISLALRSQLQGIFAEYGVDIVLQGHDHLISRTYPISANGTPATETWQTQDGVEYSVNPNGVLYLMNGPSGSQTRDVYSADSSLYKYAQKSKTGSWAEISIDGNKLKVTVKYLSEDGTETYQEWGIIKNK